MIPKSKSIPVEYIQQCFEYREEWVDGVLQGNVYWKYREDIPKHWNTRYAGKKSGSIDSYGYYRIIIKYNSITANILLHNVVWILNNGVYPSGIIDHIDRNKTNNLISNLREADAYLNNLNTPSIPNKSSQYKGVSWSKSKSKWLVQYSLNNKVYFVNRFVNELEAALAYNEAISKIHNTEFAYMNDISMGYTNKEYPNKPRGWKPE